MPLKMRPHFPILGKERKREIEGKPFNSYVSPYVDRISLSSAERERAGEGKSIEQRTRED